MDNTQRRFLSPQASRGSIFILTVWVFLTLTIFSMALADFVFSQIRFTNFFMRNSASLPLAEAAYWDALYERREPREAFDYDTERALSSPREVNLCARAGYRYYFADEGSRININMANSRVLARLPGLNEDLAKLIINSKRRPFKVKEEVMLVEGITGEQFKQFKDIITVYGDGKVNINTATDKTLSALGMDDSLIKIIMRYRKEYKGSVETDEDDGAFTDTGSISLNLNNFASLELKQQQLIISLMSVFAVKSTCLRVVVVPLINGKPGITYSIVISPGNKKILLWSQEG